MDSDVDTASFRTAASWLAGVPPTGDMPALRSGLIPASGSGFHAVGAMAGEDGKRTRRAEVSRSHAADPPPAAAPPPQHPVLAVGGWRDNYKRVISKPVDRHHFTTPITPLLLVPGAAAGSVRMTPLDAQLQLQYRSHPQSHPHAKKQRQRPHSAAAAGGARQRLPLQRPMSSGTSRTVPALATAPSGSPQAAAGGVHLSQTRGSGGTDRTALRLRLCRDLPQDYFITDTPAVRARPSRRRSPSPGASPPSPPRPETTASTAAPPAHGVVAMRDDAAGAQPAASIHEPHAAATPASASASASMVRDNRYYAGDTGLQFTEWTVVEAKVQKYQQDRAALNARVHESREHRWSTAKARAVEAEVVARDAQRVRIAQAERTRRIARAAKWLVVEEQDEVAVEELHARRRIRKEASVGWWRLAKQRWRGIVDISTEAACVRTVEDEWWDRLALCLDEVCQYETQLRRLLYKDFMEKHGIGIRAANEEYQVHYDSWERRRRWQNEQDQQCHRFFHQEGMRRDLVITDEVNAWERLLMEHAEWQEEMRNAEIMRRRRRQEAYQEQQRVFARERANCEYEETNIRPKIKVDEERAWDDIEVLAEKDLEEVKEVLRIQFEQRMLALRQLHRKEQEPVIEEEQRVREDIAEESMYAAHSIYLHYLEVRDIIQRPVRLTPPEDAHHVCATETYCAAGAGFKLKTEFNPYVHSRVLGVTLEFGIADGYVPGDSVGLLRMRDQKIRDGARLFRIRKQAAMHYAKVSGRSDEHRTWEEAEQYDRQIQTMNEAAGIGDLQFMGGEFGGFQMSLPSQAYEDGMHQDEEGSESDEGDTSDAEEEQLSPQPAGDTKPVINRWLRVDMVVHKHVDVIREIDWLLQRVTFRAACDTAPWTSDADMRDRTLRMQVTIMLTPTHLEAPKCLKMYQCTLVEAYPLKITPPFFHVPLLHKHVSFHLDGEYVASGQRSALAFYERINAHHPERDAAGCTLVVSTSTASAEGDRLILKAKGGKLGVKDHPKNGKTFVTTFTKDICEVTQGSLTLAGAPCGEVAFRFTSSAKQKHVQMVLKALRFYNQQKVPDRPRRCVTMVYTEAPRPYPRQITEKVWINMMLPEDAGPTILSLGSTGPTAAMVYRPLSSANVMDPKFDQYTDHYHMPLAASGFVENQHSLGVAEYDYARFPPGTLFFKVEHGVQLGDMLTLRPLKRRPTDRPCNSVLFIDVPNRSIAFNGIHVAKYSLEIGGAHSVGTYEGATSPAWLRVDITAPLTEQEVTAIVRSLHFTNKAQKVVNGVRWISGQFTSEDPVMLGAPPAKTRTGLRVCLPVMVLPMRHQFFKYTEGDGSRRYGSGFEIPDPVFKDDDIVSVYDGGSIRVQIIHGLTSEDCLGLADDPKFYEITPGKRRLWSLRFNGSQAKHVGRFVPYETGSGEFLIRLGTPADRRGYVDIKQKKPHATKIRKRELLLLLKNLYYRCDSEDPMELRKVLKITITDAFGAFSVSLMEVNIRAVNNKTLVTFPYPTALDFRKSGFGDYHGFQIAKGVTFTDPDTSEFRGGQGYINIALCAGGGQFDHLEVLTVDQQRRSPFYRDDAAVCVVPHGHARRGDKAAMSVAGESTAGHESGDDSVSATSSPPARCSIASPELDPTEPRLFDVYIGDTPVGTLERKIYNGGTSLHFLISLPRRWAGYDPGSLLLQPTHSQRGGLATPLSTTSSRRQRKSATALTRNKGSTLTAADAAARRRSSGNQNNSNSDGAKDGGGGGDGPPYGLPLAVAQLLLQNVIYQNLQEAFAVKTTARTYLVRVNAGDEVEDTASKVTIKTLPPLLSVPRLQDTVRYVEGSGYQSVCALLKCGLSEGHDLVRRGFLRVRVAAGFAADQDELMVTDKAGRVTALWTKIQTSLGKRKKSDIGSNAGTSPAMTVSPSPRGSISGTRASIMIVPAGGEVGGGGSGGSIGGGSLRIDTPPLSAQRRRGSTASVASVGSTGTASPRRRQRREPEGLRKLPPATHTGKLMDRRGLALVTLQRGPGWVKLLFDQPTPVGVRQLYELLKLICYRNESPQPDTTVREMECEFVWSDTTADDEHGPKGDAIDGSTSGFDSALVSWKLQIEDFDNPTEVTLPYLERHHIVASCGASLRPLQLCPKATATDPDTVAFRANSRLVFEIIGGGRHDILDFAPDGYDAQDITDPLPAPWISFSLKDDTQLIAMKTHNAVSGSTIKAEVMVKVGTVRREKNHPETLVIELHGCPIELLQVILRRVYYRYARTTRNVTTKHVQLTVHGGSDPDNQHKKEALTRISFAVKVAPAVVDYVGRAGATYPQCGPQPVHLLPPTAKVNLNNGGKVRFEFVPVKEIPQTGTVVDSEDSARFWNPFYSARDITAEDMTLFRDPGPLDMLSLLPLPTEIGTLDDSRGLLMTWGKQRLCRVFPKMKKIGDVETCHAIEIVFEAVDSRLQSAGRDQQLVKVLRHVAYVLNEKAGVPLPPPLPALVDPEGSPVLLLKLTQTLPVPKPQQMLVLVDYLTIRPKGVTPVEEDEAQAAMEQTH